MLQVSENNSIIALPPTNHALQHNLAQKRRECESRSEIWRGRIVMPLKFRPSGLSSGIDKIRPDYTGYCGGWDVGRIYQTRGGPDGLRF